MTSVINKSGTAIDFDAAVQMMDDDLREALYTEGYDTEQDFFTAYEDAHLTKYGEQWELSKQAPTW